MQKFTSGSYEIVLKRIRDIPSLPEVVNRILTVISKPNTPASEIARLISYDPGLTSKVLRMVNSAAYGFQRQISSIQHGIMILGFNTVRGLVLSASIFKLLEGHTHPDGLNHRHFWEHSLKAAIAARLLAKALHIPEVDEAFSAAMLHDIGKVVLDVYFPQEYQRVLREAKRQSIACHGPAFYHLEKRMMGITHTEVGSFLAVKWKLPMPITEAVQYHHAPQEAVNCQTLVYLVALASEMATFSDLFTSDNLPDNHFSADLLEFFEITSDMMQQYFAQLSDDILSAQDLLDSISKP